MRKGILTICTSPLCGLLLMGFVCAIPRVEPPVDNLLEVFGLAEYTTLPRWSKDGSHIVFASASSGVIVVDAKGSKI